MTTTISNGNITVVYPVTAAKATSVLTAAAHYIWNSTYGSQAEFDAMTNKQKLDLVDQYIKQVIMDAAKAYSVNTATEEARNISSKDAETNLTL